MSRGVNSEYGYIFATSDKIDYYIPGGKKYTTDIVLTETVTGESGTYSPMKKDGSAIKCANQWKKSETNGKFVGFIADKPFTTNNIEVLAFTFPSDNSGKGLVFSESTNFKAIFKESGKTFLYFITEGPGTLDKNWCYTDDTLPVATADDKSQYHFDHWEVDGVTKTDAELQSLSTDSVVKAVFTAGGDAV